LNLETAQFRFIINVIPVAALNKTGQVMAIIKPLLASALLATSFVASATPPVSARGEANLAKILADRVAGPPVDCIEQHAIDSAEVIDGTAIVYRDGNRLYVNRPASGAESLNSDDILVTDTHTPELCSIDVVHLIDRTSRFERGFVGLGKFVPYLKPRRG
jgi:hypothetical protein